jgi:hypothetical protein
MRAGGAGVASKTPDRRGRSFALDPQTVPDDGLDAEIVRPQFFRECETDA